jgi:transposase
VLTPALARELLQLRIRQVRDGTFPYLSRPTGLRDWRSYDRAATHEARDLLELLVSATEVLVQRVPRWGQNPPHGRGRPRTPTRDLLRGVLWQMYRGVANRTGSSELGLLGRDLELRGGFSYTTLGRAYRDPEVASALKALLWLTNEPMIGRERGFAIDGSGFSTTVGTHYAGARGRQRGEGRESGSFPEAPRPWVRNVANVGLEFDLVAGWKSWVDPHVGELSAFEEVFRTTAALHPEAELQVGDGLYALRAVVGRVAAAGMEARFLPRRDVTLHCRGEPAWPKSIWGLVKDPQAWLSEYHRRSRVEAFWHALKARNPSAIRKKMVAAQVTEATARAVVHNLRRLCYWRWADGTDPTPSGATLPYAE